MTVRATRLAIFFACMALMLASSVAVGAAEAGSRTREQAPSELWKTYPLNPGEGRIDADKQDADPSSASTRATGSNRRETAPADEQTPAGDWTPWVIGLLVVLGLGAFLALRRFTPMAVAADGQRPRVAAARPRAKRSGPRPEKGSTMDKWRRKARAHNSKLARRLAQADARRADEETPLPVERVSEYLSKDEAVSDDRADTPGDQPEETLADASPESEAEIAEAEGASRLTDVGEEVQSVISSAHEAAAAIRRKAKEEAARVRDEAWAAAQAEISEAQRIAVAHREDAERVRAEAEAVAAEARAAAEAFTAELRTSAEREAARMEEEARERLSAADADATRMVERADEEARRRIGSLRDEIERHEERLQRILVVLRGMTSQVEDVLAARSAGGESAVESLEDVLRLDHSSESDEAVARDEPAQLVAAGEDDGDPADEQA